MGEKRPVPKPRKRAGEGYMRSRWNATKHGLTAEHSIMPGENPEAYEALKKRYHEEWKPGGPTTESLVDELVDIDWKLRRYKKVELAEYRAQLLKTLSAAYGAADDGTVDTVGVNDLAIAHKAAFLTGSDSLLEQVFGEPQAYSDASAYSKLRAVLLHLVENMPRDLVENMPRDTVGPERVVDNLPPVLQDLWKLALEDPETFEAFQKYEGLPVVAIVDESWASFERWAFDFALPYLDMLRSNHPMALAAHKHVSDIAHGKAIEKLEPNARSEERLHARRTKIIATLIVLRGESRSAA